MSIEYRGFEITPVDEDGIECSVEEALVFEIHPEILGAECYTIDTARAAIDIEQMG